MSKWYKGVYRRQLTDMHIHDEDERFLSKFNADEYYENLVKIRAYYPEASVQFLFSELTAEIAENVKRDRFDVDAYFKTLTKEAIDDFHAAGLVVNCWTVDNPEDGARMAEWGVDFITSNILE